MSLQLVKNSAQFLISQSVDMDHLLFETKHTLETIELDKLLNFVVYVIKAKMLFIFSPLYLLICKFKQKLFINSEEREKCASSQ